MAKALTAKQQAFRKRLLQDAFGQKSSADLRIDELIRLRDFLDNKTQSLAEQASANKLAYLRALWQQRARNPDEKSLLAFARKNTGLTLINLEALTTQNEGAFLVASQATQGLAGNYILRLQLVTDDTGAKHYNYLFTVRNKHGLEFWH